MWSQVGMEINFPNRDKAELQSLTISVRILLPEDLIQKLNWK